MAHHGEELAFCGVRSISKLFRSAELFSLLLAPCSLGAELGERRGLPLCPPHRYYEENEQRACRRHSKAEVKRSLRAPLCQNGGPVKSSRHVDRVFRQLAVGDQPLYPIRPGDCFVVPGRPVSRNRVNKLAFSRPGIAP